MCESAFGVTKFASRRADWSMATTMFLAASLASVAVSGKVSSVNGGPSISPPPPAPAPGFDCNMRRLGYAHAQVGACAEGYFLSLSLVVCLLA